MILQVLVLIVGFAVLIKGANWLVDGGSGLAKKYNVSDLAVGLTIVAFGTSMPEFVVNTIAAYQNHADIVFGNIIGSNNFNLFIILGAAGIISPLVVQTSTVWKEIPFSFFAALLLYLLSNSIFSDNAVLSRFDGGILLFFFALFLFYVFFQLRNEAPKKEVKEKKMSNWKTGLFIVAGLSFLIIGGRLVVTNSVKIANELGISQTIIGLTIVAAGTSLPELATSIVAAVKKKNDIAVGNIIGSNIFNIFFILGTSALIKPVSYNSKFNFDLLLLGVGTLFVLGAMYSGSKKKLDRWEAAILLLIYVGYNVFLVYNELQ
jgi:cation:H+ antiporter